MDEPNPAERQPTKREQLVNAITAEGFDQLPEAERLALTEELLWWQELDECQKRIDRRWEDER